MDALFTKDTFAFLVENRMMNDKAWFDAHRDDYQRLVIAPLRSLCESLAPAMMRIDAQLITTPKIGGAISRIWRDTRFSGDKSLYRDNMWLSFVRQKGQRLPEFFFVITPDSFLYGTGYYAADAASMDSIRRMILDDSKEFKAARAMVEGQDLFELEGDLYKRNRHPDAPVELHPWLNRKVLSLMRTSTDFDLLYSDALGEVVAQQFEMIAPMYYLFTSAEAKVRKD